MSQQSASHFAIWAGWLVSNAMEQIVLSYWCKIPKSSTLWNYTCFPHRDPSAFVYYTNSVVQNSISYCKMRILKSKLYLALCSKCQSNWAPCLVYDYEAWTYWKTLKSIPLNKEQSNHPALWIFFSSKSKQCFTKWGRGVEENPQDPTPNRKRKEETQLLWSHPTRQCLNK